MNFHECLNEYVNKIDCTSKDLSAKSGLSGATISRYRSGEREPSKDSDAIRFLADALFILAEEKGIEGIDSKAVYDDLTSSLNEFDFTRTAHKFDLLIEVLKINASELASALNYDPSYISRVRSNKRQPYDASAFIGKVVQYTIEHCKSDKDIRAVASLIGKTPESLSDDTVYQSELFKWLLSENATANAPHIDPSSFLSKLDEFNLEEYVEGIHFNDIKIPSVPFQMTTHKSYYGLEQIREGELDFFKSTVLSKSDKPVIMCNDMPMEDMSEDSDFPKKWMFGLAVLLKKGLQINIVHNLNRPFNELIMGLEGWIPLYMTGLVNPYYIKDSVNSVYGHVHYTSGEVALIGECIESHHDKAHYYLTRKKEEVAMYREYTDFLLEKALPLMKIYKFENLDEFTTTLVSSVNCPKGILHRYTSLPIYTLDEETLRKILVRNELPEIEIGHMIEYHRAVVESCEKILETSTITDETVLINKENFEEKKPYLLLTETFCSKEIYYTYEEYEYHLKRTEEYAKSHSNYTLIRTTSNPFKNIQITIVRGKWVLITKSLHPNIHFVIHHPILRDAIENMTVSSHEKTGV